MRKLFSRRELRYFASGFCVALLLVLGWRYLGSRVLPTHRPPQTYEVPEVAAPTVKPPLTPGTPRPLGANPVLQQRNAKIREGTRRGGDRPPQVDAPFRLESALPRERNDQAPHSPPPENDQEGVASFVQETLQRKIDQNEGFRSVLYEAAKTYLEKKGKEEGR